MRRPKLFHINDSVGWHRYYVARFNRSEHPDATMLAMFFLLCALRDGELQ